MSLRKKARKPNPLKPDTRSAVRKGPARDEKHLARVRLEKCAVANSSCVVWVQAHHARCIGPRTMGKRVSDYLAISLCSYHHAALHRQNESEFWDERDVDPAAWIACFSPEGAAEIERINGAAANK